MNKPLLLTLHPRLEDTNLSPEDIRQGRWTELRMKRRKRLTDAELAAEFWKAKERCMFVSAFSGMSILPDSPTATQAIVLHRFATLPHYDEDQP